jgi:hypothetical protein
VARSDGLVWETNILTDERTRTVAQYGVEHIAQRKHALERKHLEDG